MAAPTAKPAPKPAKPAKPIPALNPLKIITHDTELAAALFSPCGQYLVAAGADATIYRYPLDTYTPTLLKSHNGWLSAIAFYDKALYSLDSWARLIAWPYADADPKARWTRDDTHKGWAKALAVSPDGQLLATAGADGHVKLWSAADGSPVATLSRDNGKPAHDASVFSLAFHPDGTALVSGDLKGNVHHWSLKDRTLIRTIDAKPLYLRPDNINDVGGVRALRFVDAGRILAAAGAQPMTSGFVTAKPAVLLFDWASAKQTHLLQAADVTAQDGFAFDVVQHPAGPLMVACSGSPGRGAVWYWPLGATAPTLNDRTQLHARSLSLHPDGKRLALVQYGRGGGNGKKLDKEGKYPGNPCTLKVCEFTPPASV